MNGPANWTLALGELLKMEISELVTSLDVSLVAALTKDGTQSVDVRNVKTCVLSSFSKLLNKGFMRRSIVGLKILSDAAMTSW